MLVIQLSSNQSVGVYVAQDFQVKVLDEGGPQDGVCF